MLPGVHKPEQERNSTVLNVITDDAGHKIDYFEIPSLMKMMIPSGLLLPTLLSTHPQSLLFPNIPPLLLHHQCHHGNIHQVLAPGTQNPWNLMSNPT
jgi:hypothetical protein